MESPRNILFVAGLHRWWWLVVEKSIALEGSADLARLVGAKNGAVGATSTRVTSVIVPVRTRLTIDRHPLWTRRGIGHGRGWWWNGLTDPTTHGLLVTRTNPTGTGPTSVRQTRASITTVIKRFGPTRGATDRAGTQNRSHGRGSRNRHDGDRTGHDRTGPRRHRYGVKVGQWRPFPKDRCTDHRLLLRWPDRWRDWCRGNGGNGRGAQITIRASRPTQRGTSETRTSSCKTGVAATRIATVVKTVGTNLTIDIGDWLDGSRRGLLLLLGGKVAIGIAIGNGLVVQKGLRRAIDASQFVLGLARVNGQHSLHRPAIDRCLVDDRAKENVPHAGLQICHAAQTAIAGRFDVKDRIADQFTTLDDAIGVGAVILWLRRVGGGSQLVEYSRKDGRLTVGNARLDVHGTAARTRAGEDRGDRLGPH